MMRDELYSILEETTKLDFPFLASGKKKAEILMKVKNEFDERIDKVLQGSGTDLIVAREVLWAGAKKHSDEEFKSLKESQRLNGFYLQEIMHEYVELQLKKIIGEE